MMNPTPIDYVRRGWALVHIPTGLKGPTHPGWQERVNAVTTAERAVLLTQGAGLLHAYSGTCAIDIDDMDAARAWLAERSIDLDALLTAPDAVAIVGRPGRGKLIYALPQPLPTKQIKAVDGHMILELRCGNYKGTTVQDVLPVDTHAHPDTQQPYTWSLGICGDWENPPPLPEALRNLWGTMVMREALAKRDLPKPHGATADTMRELLTQHDADASYDDWVKVGMALHHETGGSDDGLALWDEWSARGSKYIGLEDLENHWRSFGNHPRPLTLASLRPEPGPAPYDAFDALVPAGIAAPAELAAAKPERRRFEFVGLGEFTDQPPLAWHVYGVLPQTELGVIYGQPGSGKSFLALDLALSISRNTTWRDRDVEPGRVAYIVAEGQKGFAQRVKAAARQLGVAPDDINMRVLAARPNVFDAEQAKELCGEILALGRVSVVVMDTLTAVTAGSNLNDQVDMTTVVEHCTHISRKTGAFVLLIHHSGKDAARGMRGSNVLDGAAEMEMETVVIGDTHIATIVKMKDGSEGDRFAFKLVPVTLGHDAKGKEINSCIVQHCDLPAGSKDGRKTALKGLPKLVYDTALEIMGIDTRDGDVKALVEAVVNKMPEPETGEKDRRAARVRQALTESLSGKFIDVEGWRFHVVA